MARGDSEDTWVQELKAHVAQHPIIVLNLEERELHGLKEIRVSGPVSIDCRHESVPLCGFLGSSQRACRCTPDQVARYQGKLSGPLLDPIDLHVEVPALPAEQLVGAPAGEASATVRERVERARARALARQGHPNQALQGQGIDELVMLQDDALQFLQRAANRLGWSARSTHRTLRVARTIADLAGATHTGADHVAEAVQLRRGLHHTQH